MQLYKPPITLKVFPSGLLVTVKYTYHVDLHIFLSVAHYVTRSKIDNTAAFIDLIMAAFIDLHIHLSLIVSQDLRCQDGGVYRLFPV